jgi:uncharacterized protein (TIGR02466 family)
MAKINIFNEFILTGILQDSELDQLIIETLEKNIVENKQRVKSNEGGFQTTDITNEIILKKLLNKTNNILQENFNFFKDFEINLRNAWINKNNKNNYNYAHHHIENDLSGVYYTQTFSEQGGELVFYRDNSKLLDSCNLYKVLDCAETHTEYSIKPINNMIIIFPSYLTHEVKPSKMDGRISTAFNIDLLI